MFDNISLEVKMKVLNIPLEEEEYKALAHKKIELGKTWKEMLLLLKNVEIE